MGALFGWTIASFASSSGSSTNQFEAEAVFGPGHTGVTGAASCGNTATTVTVAEPVAAGDTVIVRLSLRDVRNYFGISGSDSAGNTYTLDGTADNGGRVLTAVLSAYVASPLAVGSTITINHHRARSAGVTADSFDDIVPAGRVFAVATGTGAGSTPSVTVNTPAGSAIIIGAITTRNRATITQPAGWTSLQGGQVSCRRRFTQATGHMNTFSAGTATYDPTFNRNRRWAEVVVSYIGT